MSSHATIVSTGCYVPEREVTNDALRERFRESAPEFVDKMEAGSGILTRFYAPDDWATSDLATRAAQQALDNAGVTADQVDLIVLGTDTPDYITPATSVVVQRKLEAFNAGTFDIGCACASFPTGIATAAGLMSTNPALRNVLVIGVYMMHKLADPTDPVVFFYGDGAGAALLQRSEAPGVMQAAFRADGRYATNWGIFSGGTVEPASETSVREGRTQVRMTERYPPEINNEGWPAVLRAVAERSAFGIDEIDLAIFTQVRKGTILEVAREVGLPESKCHMIMHKWGYTGSACLAMALHDAIGEGKIQPGSLVTFVGSGVGYNQAGVAVRFTDALRPHREGNS